MREFMSPVEPVRVDTVLGQIQVAPLGAHTVRVNCPSLTVNGVPLRASALLASGDLWSWDLVQQWDPKTQRFSMSPDALVATLVDGRDADLVTQGKIAEAIIPAVNKLAQVNQGLFLESSRRELNNEIATMEREV